MQDHPHRRRFLATAGIGLTALAAHALADAPGLPDAKPVPRMQVRPLPDAEASFEREGKELTRYHFRSDLRRPYLYPIIGPSGQPLTRMGHPHDPEGHSHHNSVWISHNNVNGDDFWGDRGAGRIIHQRVLRYDDADSEASMIVVNAWTGKEDRVHLNERRAIRVRPLEDGQWMLILDLQLDAASGPVTLGATAFGPIGVRMTKSIGVNDGGGRIRNSEGNVNEQGPNGVFHKPARWVDYSGPVAPDAVEGITLLDHPANPAHPCPFHVRADGWMGASPTLTTPLTIEPGKALRLRYGLFVHSAVPSLADLDARWKTFAQESIAALS